MRLTITYGASYGQCIKAIKRNEEKDAKEGLCLLVTENQALEEETCLEQQKREIRRIETGQLGSMGQP